MQGIASARIWYQSFTDPAADSPYFTRLSGYLRSVAGPGCTVEVFGIHFQDAGLAGDRCRGCRCSS